MSHIYFTHLSKASEQSQKHKLCFPATLQLWCFSLVCLARGLNFGVICLPLKMFTWKWSYLLSRRQEACHILKICGAPSEAAHFWRQNRYLWGLSHWHFSLSLGRVHIKIWYYTSLNMVANQCTVRSALLASDRQVLFQAHGPHWFRNSYWVVYLHSIT